MTEDPDPRHWCREDGLRIPGGVYPDPDATLEKRWIRPQHPDPDPQHWSREERKMVCFETWHRYALNGIIGLIGLITGYTKNKVALTH